MSERPLVVAHRGLAKRGEDENTLTACAFALGLGADFIELDIRETSDGELICYHDSEIKDRKVEEMTYTEVIYFSGRMVPKLDEIMHLCKDKVGLDIEIKEKGCEKKVIDTVKKSFGLDKVVFTSFKDEVVKEIKELEPKSRAGLILGLENPSNLITTRFTELFPRHRLVSCNADFVAPNYQLLRLNFVNRMKNAGFPVWAWTVNGENLEECMHSGVAAVITDDADIALAL